MARKPQPSATLGDPYVYRDLNEVPPPWRSHRGARLSVEQVNWIVANAYENPHDNGEAVTPDYVNARTRFEERNQIENGLWVPRKGR